MADDRVEVTCPGCGHAFLAARFGGSRLAECPGCGGWIGVAPDAPAVNPSEFLQGQLGAARRDAGAGADVCGA
jgi:hypothetical protein